MRLAVVVALGCLMTAGVAGARPGHTRLCDRGRLLLTCAEQQAFYTDAASWQFLAPFDALPLEVSIPVGAKNRALAQYLRFETATATARAEFEFLLILQTADPDFEQIAPPPALSTPVIHPAGVIDARTAAVMTRLLVAEREEVANLEAMVIALDRATAARYDFNRPDWSAWQMSAAGTAALHVGAAIRREIPLQRALSVDLVRRRLLIGLGATDVALMKQAVRRHGLSRSLTAVLERFHLRPSGLRHGILTLGPTPSLDLARSLAAPRLLAAERRAAATMDSFARRIPHHGRPAGA